MTLELTVEALRAAKFRGPVRFYDGAKGMARQDFECVDEPRFGYFWRRENRQDKGRQAYTVDGTEVPDLGAAIKLLGQPVPADSPEQMMRRGIEEFKYSPPLTYGATHALSEARCNADAGPFAMLRASFERGENAWHQGINALSDDMRKAGDEWPRWLYATKTAFQETYRAQYLFEADAKEDTGLRCALGVKCRDCPILQKIDQTMRAARDNPKWPRDIEEPDIIAAKTMTCIGHVLSTSPMPFLDGAIFSRKGDEGWF